MGQASGRRISGSPGQQGQVDTGVLRAALIAALLLVVAAPAVTVTAVLVTSNPGPLARLTITDLRNCLRATVTPSAWPRLQIVHVESGDLALAAWVSAVSDATETAVRIHAGRITARAEGYGACHAAASAQSQR